MTPCRLPLRRLLATLAAGLPLLGLALATPASAAVVISQVYGAGGNNGAVLKSDFIELFNNGAAAVNVGGWSVQYASAGGTTWAVTPIPANTVLQPGRYLLVRQAQGTGGSLDVTTDVPGGSIAMGGASGKVALASNATAFSGTVPAGAIDFVGYGAATTAEVVTVSTAVGLPSAVVAAP
jgi:uncharacterized protein